MGKRGKAWGELDLEDIAGRVAARNSHPDVNAAVKALVVSCRKAGLSAEDAKSLLDEAFAPVSARPSVRSRR